VPIVATSPRRDARRSGASPVRSRAVWTALLVVPAYLLGTFPTAILIARAHGRDVRTEGSGNPGASNVMRLLGWKVGLLAFAGDMAKAAIAAGVGLAVGGRVGGYVLGVAAVLGHVFPVTRGWKGGRGVASGGGMLLVLHPLVALPLIVVWAVLGFGLKRASIASLVVAVAAPPLVWLTGRDAWEVAVVAVVALLVLARHAANLRRLVTGRELRLDGGHG
jgi:acyl phosphate:glycerol-3-phosphate acyltransferase